MTDTLLLAFDDERALAEELAQALGMSLDFVTRHRFPDGELRLVLPKPLPARVILLRGLQQPNEKLVELLIAAPAARELGAQVLTLVSPYLAYMRQDMEFTPGEAVSQRHIARLLAAQFDRVLTIDPHLHRIASLDEVMPAGTGLALSAAPLLGRWIAERVPGALLLGPDEESGQWVSEAARAGGLDHAVGRKVRHGDHAVSLALPQVEVQGRAVVLLDDMASTGRTLIGAAQGLLARGAASVDVAVTHALFNGDALPALQAVGVRHVWSSNSVPHASNAVSVVPLLAATLRPLLTQALP
ncbi:ribose-phosphate diphosphokinase [Paucibacter sp. XJ19-41]|uniref:ribose-phosphate diphosphokinase n=1 Tax=Paucibacter sp. XJ19-41 TaxID=2927824 RepID=UPI00234B04A3|nr:ribose-phosphate diphosphokinase [Paucibacter sp. XJ19-41]MDC6167192.1 ribose-phosphate diphosphokinase [Paucibacter sp. XJ19-41]